LTAGRLARATPWLLLAGLLAMGLLARALAGEAWTSFTRYPTPFAFANPGARTTPRLVDGVVIVLVDGLGLEASREMPFLNGLRARGADFECRIGMPSFSLPGRAVMFTGAWQESHGQATNFNPRPLPVEHVFLTAKKKGLLTAMTAHEDTLTMFGRSIDSSVVFPELHWGQSMLALRQELTRMAEASRRLMTEKKPQLFQLEFHMPDEVGHGWGAGSREYHDAALAVDEELRGIEPLVDLSRTVLIVTSDHGHTRTGGHGGPEEPVLRVPLVMLGGPVVPGAKGSCLQVDVASTIAALLGIEIPASNEGHPLLAALHLDGASRREVLKNLHQQRKNFVERYAAVLAGTPVVAAEPAGMALDDDGIDWGPRIEAVDALQQQAQQARIARERRSRLPIFLLLLVPLLVLASLRLLGVVGGWEWGAALIAALLAVGLYHALFPVVGLQYSFSAMNKDEELEPFFRKDMILGVAVTALAVGAASVARRRQGPASRLDIARLSWLIAAWVGAYFLARIGYVIWRWGAFLRWHMPDPVWGFGFYLDVLVLMALGFSALLLPLVGFAGSWLGGRRFQRALAR
jgi:hypothetical protein